MSCQSFDQCRHSTTTHGAIGFDDDVRRGIIWSEVPGLKVSSHFVCILIAQKFMKLIRDRRLARFGGYWAEGEFLKQIVCNRQLTIFFEY